MGNEWEEEYRERIKKIRFSEKEKKDLVERLASAPQSSMSEGVEEAWIVGTFRSGKKSAWRNISRRGVAACLTGVILMAGVAGASAAGLLKPVSDVFKEVFRLTDNNKEIAEEMGTALGISAVSHGIRVTADAVLTDPYSYAIVFSVEREDGKPLLPKDRKVSSSDEWDFGEFTEEGFSDYDGEAGWACFHSYDEDPEDVSIQYVAIRTYSSRQNVEDGFTVCLQDFCHYTENIPEKDWEVQGKWKLHIPYELSVDSAVTMAEGEEIAIGDSTVTIENITLSPMSGHIQFWAPRNQQWDAVDYLKPLIQSKIVLELKNGKEIRLGDQGVFVDEEGDRVGCTFVACFDTLIPLSDMKSIHIEDMEWLVQEKESD